MDHDADSSSRRHPARHPGRGTETEVWLARHGEVHPDWQGRVYGSLDVPLSLEGERETLAVIERFRPLELGGVFSSNLQRALQFGRGVAEATGAPLVVESGLAEIDRGRWQGMPVAELLREREHEVSAFYADPWTWNGHGGENDRAVLERAVPVLERALGFGRCARAARLPLQRDACAHRQHGRHPPPALVSPAHRLESRLRAARSSRRLEAGALQRARPLT